ncbi:YheU family protein [Haliea sp. E17]|uniref:YheU family protein n=1 Tax=Haliea sp. E17 TaxID=3401576 RepID=UPI003AAF5AE7
MTSFVEVPVAKLAPDTLQALLEEFASRDGTDYGEVELTLAQKVGNLRRQIERGELCILFHLETEDWDLVKGEDARRLQQDA